MRTSPWFFSHRAKLYAFIDRICFATYFISVYLDTSLDNAKSTHELNVFYSLGTPSMVLKTFNVKYLH